MTKEKNRLSIIWYLRKIIKWVIQGWTRINAISPTCSPTWVLEGFGSQSLCLGASGNYYKSICRSWEMQHLLWPRATARSGHSAICGSTLDSWDDRSAGSPSSLFTPFSVGTEVKCPLWELITHLLSAQQLARVPGLDDPTISLYPTRVQVIKSDLDVTYTSPVLISALMLRDQRTTLHLVCTAFSKPINRTGIIIPYLDLLKLS